MAVVHIKSSQITNLDASPSVALTAGEGGPGTLKIIDGTATLTASATVDSTIQLVRIPSNAKVKKVFFETAAQTSGALDIGLYYATDGQGQKPLVLLASQAIDQDFFASAIVVTGTVAITDVTNESLTYTPDKRLQPIWQAVGLTSDPGGSFDVCGTITTNTTTAAAVMGLTVMYTD